MVLIRGPLVKDPRQSHNRNDFAEALNNTSPTFSPLCYIAIVKPAGRIFLFLFLLAPVSCAKSLFQQTRDQVRTFDGADFKKEDVEVVDVQERGDHAIVEVRVKTAVKMVRKDGKWNLEEVRLADRRWEKAEIILQALELKRAEATRIQLAQVAEAVRNYQRETGGVPSVPKYSELIDLLSPRYLEQIIRIDAWSRPFFYQKLQDGGFELRSAGSDGKFGSADDLVESGGS